jgi:hypothetical protein
MLKKIYKKDGIIIINNQEDNHSIDFYYFMIHHYKKGYTIQDYLKLYYSSKKFIYS